jgi:hypothetical protein
MDWPGWVDVCFIVNLVVMVATIILFATLSNDSSGGHCFAAIFGLLITIVLVAVIAIGARKVPTGEHTYTISITEPTTYKELIDKGYKISEPLYDNMNIYEITGDPLQ